MLASLSVILFCVSVVKLSLVKRDLVLGLPNRPTCWVLDYQEDPFPSLGRDTGAGAGTSGAERGG